MSTAERIRQPLVDGEKLTRDEFLRRWEQLPNLKFAELLEGAVYVPSPLSPSHSTHNGGGDHVARLLRRLHTRL